MDRVETEETLETTRAPLALSRHPPSDFQQVMARMRFADAELCAEWLLLNRLYEDCQYNSVMDDESGVHYETGITIGTDDLLEVVQGHGLRVLGPQYASAGRRGYTVGYLLAALYGMHVRGIDAPSLNKAIYLWRRFTRGTKWAPWQGGGEIPSSEPVLRRYLKEFLPVGHLWAAYVLNERLKLFSVSDVAPQDIYEMLGLARGIAETLRTCLTVNTRTPVPVINVERFIPIPDWIEPFSAVLEAPTVGLRRALDEYSAPRTG